MSENICSLLSLLAAIPRDRAPGTELIRIPADGLGDQSDRDKSYSDSPWRSYSRMRARRPALVKGKYLRRLVYPRCGHRSGWGRGRGTAEPSERLNEHVK